MVQQVERFMSIDGSVFKTEREALYQDKKVRKNQLERQWMNADRIEVTDAHLKLLRRMNIGWGHCEYGAPCVDPKRPYGNIGVECDIREIVTGQSTFDGELSDEELIQIRKLHVEMKHVLQILVYLGSVEPGVYVEKLCGQWERK